MPSLNPNRIDEEQLSDEVFDQPPSPVRAKVFICASGRTGSWLLCRAMIHHGIGIPHEYYNARHISQIGRRHGIDALADGKQLGTDSAARRSYNETLLARRSPNGIFSAKIHWGQYAAYLDNPEGDALFQDGHFIHLYREDLLSQAISFHVSMETGRWGLDATVTTRPAVNPRFFDTDRIAGHMKTLAEADMNWRMFFGRNAISPISLSYEHVKHDLSDILRVIVERFGLDVPRDIPEYVEPGPSEARDSNVPPRSEIRARFIAAHRRVVSASRTDANGPSPPGQVTKVKQPRPASPDSKDDPATYTSQGTSGHAGNVPSRPHVGNGRQKICLCMIVKNEATIIRQCLESVRPVIDYWIIADTGSTDGTQDAIAKYFHDVPGKLHQRPWVDFAHNRSETLVFAKPHGDYSLIIDADDMLDIPPGFKMPYLGADSYTVEIRNKGRRHWRPHLIRNTLPWRYEGVLHEFLSYDPDQSGSRVLSENRSQKQLPGLKILIGEGGARRQLSAAERYRRDAAVLERALAIETDPFLLSRYTFYLGQSLQNGGEGGRALDAYQKRATLGFWDQEVYISLYRAANLKAELGFPDEEVIAAYLQAHALCKVRAEALHGAAWFCRIKEAFQRGFDLAQRALRIPMPNSGLFLESWIYEYGVLDEYAVNAYWIGKYDECLEACRKLLASRATPVGEHGRIQANADSAAREIQKRKAARLSRN